MTTYHGPDQTNPHFISYEGGSLDEEYDEELIAELFERTEKIIDSSPVYETETTRKNSEQAIANTISTPSDLFRHVDRAVVARLKIKTTQDSVEDRSRRYAVDAVTALENRVHRYRKQSIAESEILREVEDYDQGSFPLAIVQYERENDNVLSEILSKYARLFDEKLDKFKIDRTLRYQERLAHILDDVASMSEEDEKFIKGLISLSSVNIDKEAAGWEEALDTLSEYLKNRINEHLRFHEEDEDTQTRMLREKREAEESRRMDNN